MNFLRLDYSIRKNLKLESWNGFQATSLTATFLNSLLALNSFVTDLQLTFGHCDILSCLPQAIRGFSLFSFKSMKYTTEYER